MAIIWKNCEEKQKEKVVKQCVHTVQFQRDRTDSNTN